MTIGVALLLPAALALADGEGPSRKMTGPEAAAFDDLKRAVQEALPKTPANYTLAFGDGSGPEGAGAGCARLSIAGQSGEAQGPAALGEDGTSRKPFTPAGI